MVPAASPTPLLDALGAVLTENGVDARAWALGFSRVTPAVTLVPAFGLGALPVQARLTLALALGLCIAPALSVPAAEGPLLLAMAGEALRGLPTALLAAVATYTAMTAGGLVDDLRGAKESVTLPSLPEQLPPVATLFALLSCIAFLETGGAARVAGALAAPLDPGLSWPAVARAFARSFDLAFALAAPLAIASVVLETASALIARAATPAFIGPVLAPLKSVALLGVLALVLDRVTELLAVLSHARP